MKILFIVSRPLEINTSASIRNRATIEGLLKLGNNVDLITTQYDENHSNYDNSFSNDRLEVNYLKIGGIQEFARYGRKFKFLKPLKNIAYKFFSYFEIYDNLKGMASYTKNIKISDEDYDVVISSSDPKSSHLFVRRMFEAGLIKNTPWIQIWGDPFLSDITRKSSFMNFMIKTEEERLLDYATKVIYVSNLTLKEQQELYKHYATKMFYEPIPYVEKKNYPISEIKESLTFLYCGDYHSSIRNLKPLYNAIKNSKHKLIICGSSDIQLESIDRIKVYPRVSYEKTKYFETECDVLIHLSNLQGNQIPGKVYQFSGTNKPILFLLDGQKNLLRETFEKYNRYTFCENDTNMISNVLENIRLNNTKVVNKPIDEFSGENIANKILSINK